MYEWQLIDNLVKIKPGHETSPAMRMTAAGHAKVPSHKLWCDIYIVKIQFIDNNLHVCQMWPGGRGIEHPQT